jgi:flagellar hook-associated protein 3 FlgL
MRISDAMRSSDFLYNLNITKVNEDKLREQISTQSKINTPSDDPAGAAKLLNLNNQIGQTNIYTQNVLDSLSFNQETNTEMGNIQDEVVNVMSSMTSAQNAAVNGNLNTFADKIDSSLSLILDSANSQSNGKYIFGGTDFSNKPYALSSDSESVLTQVNTSGVQSVRVSSNSVQKINITGTELFGTIVKQTGTFDSAASNGTVNNSSSKVYDNAGNAYDLNLTYTKTGTDTYSLNYDIKDSTGASVYSTSPAASTLKFDPTNMQLVSIDNSSNTSLNVKSPTNNINFNLDLSSVQEGTTPQALSTTANQKTDIFNILIAIRDELRSGTRPTDAQVQAVSDFNSHLLDKLAAAGTTSNQLSSTNDLLTAHKTVLITMESQVQSVDVAQAVTDLQNQDNILQESLKIAATILPKSLMDYLTI